jgi:hypothetical protein
MRLPAPERPTLSLPPSPPPKVVFHKPCLGKGMIQSGAEADARRSWAALAAAVSRHAAAGSPAAGALSAGAPAVAANGPAGVECASPAPTSGAVAPAGWARSLADGLLGPGASGSSGIALGCLAVVVCVLGLAVWHAGATISADIRELSSAIRDATAAGCPAANKLVAAAIAAGGGGGGGSDGVAASAGAQLLRSVGGGQTKALLHLLHNAGA